MKFDLNIFKSLTSNSRTVLKRYIKSLSVINVIYGDPKISDKKGSSIIVFNDQYGKGQVEFRNKQDLIDFCTALGEVAKNIK